MTKPKSDEEQYGESTNPFPEIHEGMAKEKLRRKMEKAGLKTVGSMYNVVWDEDTKKKNKIKKTAKKLAKLKNKKGGGMIKYRDGGSVGNTTANYRGCH